MKFLRDGSGQLTLVAAHSSVPVSPIKEGRRVTAFIMDVRELVHTWDEKIENYVDEVFYNPARMNEAVVWNIFLHYIFPWMLDFFKVFCLFKVLTAWFKDSGQEGRFGGNGGGMQALYKWGGAYFLFTLSPFAFELIDQASQKMYHELMKDGSKGWTPE